jgi:hypothetical protein
VLRDSNGADIGARYFNLIGEKIMQYYNITYVTGKRGRLVSDDTFTLAFCPGRVESTPGELRARVSVASLKRLAKIDDKAARALDMEAV